MHKWPTFSRLVLLLSFVATVLFIGSRDLNAQAAPAAERNGELSANFAYSVVCPKWNGISDTNNGFTFGLEYVHYFRHMPPVTPSFVFRGKIAPGNTVGERTFGGGLKLERAFGAFRPYGDFLISSGVVTFTHPVIDVRGKLYSSDNSIV